MLAASAGACVLCGRSVLPQHGSHLNDDPTMKGKDYIQAAQSCFPSWLIKLRHHVLACAGSSAATEA